MKPDNEIAAELVIAALIIAGEIKSTNYVAGVPFAVSGSRLDLTNGNFNTTALDVNGTTGVLSVRGAITCTAFTLLHPTLGHTVATMASTGYIIPNTPALRLFDPTGDEVAALAWMNTATDATNFQIRQASPNNLRTANTIVLTSNDGALPGLDEMTLTNTKGQLYLTTSGGGHVDLVAFSGAYARLTANSGATEIKAGPTDITLTTTGALTGTVTGAINLTSSASTAVLIGSGVTYIQSTASNAYMIAQGTTVLRSNARPSLETIGGVTVGPIYTDNWGRSQSAAVVALAVAFANVAPVVNITHVRGGFAIVAATFDFDCIALGGGACIGQLVFNGVAQASQAIFTAQNVGDRATVTQVWFVGTGAGLNTFQIQAAKQVAGGNYNCNQQHTQCTVISID